MDAITNRAIEISRGASQSVIGRECERHEVDSPLMSLKSTVWPIPRASDNK